VTTRSKFFLVLAATLLLQAGGKVAAADKFLGAEKLWDLFAAGRTVAWETARGSLKGISEFRADGTILVAWNSPARSGSDAGRWWIEGAKLCLRYNAVHSGNKRCYRFKLVSSKQFLALDEAGDPAFTYDLK
jgi:hypothetical protein